MRNAVTCRWSKTVWHISRNVCVVTQGLPQGVPQVSHEFARGAMPHVNSAIRIIEGPAMVFMIGLDVYIYIATKWRRGGCLDARAPHKRIWPTEVREANRKNADRSPT